MILRYELPTWTCTRTWCYVVSGGGAGSKKVRLKLHMYLILRYPLRTLRLNLHTTWCSILHGVGMGGVGWGARRFKKLKIQHESWTIPRSQFGSWSAHSHGIVWFLLEVLYKDDLKYNNKPQSAAWWHAAKYGSGGSSISMSICAWSWKKNQRACFALVKTINPQAPKSRYVEGVHVPRLWCRWGACLIEQTPVE